MFGGVSYIILSLSLDLACLFGEVIRHRLSLLLDISMARIMNLTRRMNVTIPHLSAETS